MALEVEDGTGKADANSYVSVAEYRAYAQARGVSLPVDDAQVEAQLTQAMDYVESFRAKYQGRKTWPRPGMDVSHPPAQATRQDDGHFFVRPHDHRRRNQHEKHEQQPDRDFHLADRDIAGRQVAEHSCSGQCGICAGRDRRPDIFADLHMNSEMLDVFGLKHDIAAEGHGLP